MTSIRLHYVSRLIVWRAIPSRFPPIDLFQQVAPASEWDALNRIEDATNQRRRESAASTGLVLPEDRVEGSTSHYILGPLSHPNPEGSIFSDGSYGVVYCAFDFDTMIAEVKAQREQFLRNTDEGPQRIDMRVILLDLDGELHDLRGRSLTDWAVSRGLAAQLRRDRSYGVLFDSPQNPGGTCAAVFRPPVLSNARQERHFAFVWNGREITDRYDLTLADKGPGHSPTVGRLEGHSTPGRLR